MFQHSFSISKNTCTESLPALPWPSGCGSLWPQFHFCYSQPQSVDLGSAEETKKGGRERGKMSHPVFFIARQEVPRYFWAELKNAQHGGDRETPWCRRACETRQKLKCVERRRKKEQGLVTLTGKHLLTEGRARFTKLLFQCNVCTALFYEKRKVPSERW